MLVVGAGLSGIGAAWHLQTLCPDRSYRIVEARGAIGGTWDVFRYPGVRSDSDMYTLGYAFRPWTGDASIAEGAAIRDYIVETARAYGIDERILFHRRVIAADWSSAEARWTVTLEGPAGREVMRCGLLYLCAGYYDFDTGHAPAFAGADRFAGTIVHPQFWPEDLDVTGGRVAVIGSGATAITLVPALARTAAQVTMVQRSPSYVVALPGRDRIAAWLQRTLGKRAAYRLVRAKNVTATIALFQAARRWPERTARRIVAMAQAALGPEHDAAVHFTPSYKPWDQRVCLSPDGDLFTAIRQGRAAVVTGAIAAFEPDGIRMASGDLVPADVVVTATGLSLKVAGGVALSIDTVPTSLAGRMLYRGMMFDGVPNLAFAFGYTNASWTLKADLTARYVCRLLKTMARNGARSVVPVRPASAADTEAFVPFSSGYIARAADRLPVQGRRRPWRLYQNYILDWIALRMGSVRRDLRFDP